MSGVLGETGLPDTITPQWSPDGKFVYFLKRSEGTTKIWRAATDRRDSRPFSSDPGDINNFVISSDGQRIIYSSWMTDEKDREDLRLEGQIGRASCRERVCQYV